jgi:hypothetical protein
VAELSHKSCPFCGSSDAFSYSTETGMFSCFSCAATPKNKHGRVFNGRDLIPFNQSLQLEEGLALEPYVRDYRGIKKSVLEDKGVYFTKLGDRETVHYHYPHAVKSRTLPKTITTSGQLDSFYGQDDYNGGKVITITEGEEDRLSVVQIMGDWPVVSVPGANPSKAFWLSAREYLKNFEKIVLSLDNDDPGNLLAEKFFRAFPGKVYRVNHGKYKDANDFLQAGDQQEYKTSWWNAQKVKPENINTTAEDFIRVYDETPNYEFFKTNIEELDSKMLGIHKGAFTLVIAPTGIGKTEVFRYLEYQCYKGSDYSFAFCHGEETELRSLLGLVSYELQDNLTRKDLIEEKGREAEVKEVLKAFGESERFYQFKIGLSDTVDDIVENIRFLATAMGVDFFFIEPIQDFISGDTSTKENLLTDLVNKMKRMAPELNVGIVVIAHANEDGDAKYCKSITQSAAYEIVLDRDRESEDPIEQNRTYVSVGRKNRTGGGSGPAGCLSFSVDSYTLAPDHIPVAVPVKAKSKKEVVVANKFVQDDDIPF